MDAVDDREVKLQRASGDLVLEFSNKLPSLLWKIPKGQDTRLVRRWSPAAKTEKLVTLVSRSIFCCLSFGFDANDGHYSSNLFKSGHNYLTLTFRNFCHL